MADVRHFGAKGDGTSDDTNAIRHAIAQGDGPIEFPRGRYLLRETVEIDLARTGYLGLVGSQGTAQIIMAGSGPAFRFVGHHGGTAVPESLQPVVSQRERMPMVSNLEITGTHPEADGIQLRQTMQVTLQGVLLRKLRHAVHLVDRNRNFLMTGCHVYDNGGVGVFFDHCNLHQANLSANHISYCRQAGIKSLGGDVHNIQIVGNDIEYNYDRGGEAAGSADVWFDVSQDGVISEVTIQGNTIQSVVSPGGTNLRLVGRPGEAHGMVRLFTVAGNVLGSQETNLELRFVDRAAVTGNTIYDGRRMGIDAEHCQYLVLSGNVFGWHLAAERKMSDGMRLRRCRAVTITGSVFPASNHDGAQPAVMGLFACDDVAVTNCQFVEPAPRAVLLEDCRGCRVAGNQLTRRREPSAEEPGIESRGDSGGGNLVQGNQLSGAWAKEPIVLTPSDIQRENHVEA